MLINFLSAAVPLTKTFTLKNREIETEPYPFVKNFTSHTEEVATLEDFSTALKLHAALGHCLLKGTLTRPLIDESRAGATQSTALTNYLCLDLDFDDGFNQDVENFLSAIGISNTGYIWQRSASAGVKYSPDGLRGHCFVQLTHPASPQQLKSWLMYLNMSVPALRRQITLTAHMRGLKWPLDITTCGEDKLIYIAPPTILDSEGQPVPDPLLNERITCHSKMPWATWNFTPPDMSPAILRNDMQELIDELREQQGLDKKKAKYKTYQGKQVLTNPGHADITGVKEARGYTYLNLNGGDSWGYYFPTDRPHILFNFKGEDNIELKQLNYDFWHSLQPPTRQPNVNAYTFLNREQNQRYTCLHNPETDQLTLTPVATKDLVMNFRGLYGLPFDDLETLWDVVFDPSTTKQIDPDKCWVNLYSPSRYAATPPNPNVSLKDTPIIHRVIHNVLAHNPECISYFLNWLAYAFQTKQKAGVAWLLHGIEGTGKGVLFHNIITPLFGERYCIAVSDDALREKFNDYRDNRLFVLIDEVNLTNDVGRSESNVHNKLKSVITEAKTSIRAMRTSPVIATCYDNIIIASNDQNPVRLSENDRRFNIPPRAEQKLAISTHEILFQIPDELETFAGFLAAYAVNEVHARTPLNTQPRQQMIEQSVPSVDVYAQALRKGDLQPFIDELRTRSNATQPSNLSVIPITGATYYAAYDRVVRTVTHQANQTGVITLSRTEIDTLFTYLRNETMSPAKMTRFLRITGFVFKPLATSQERGVEIPAAKVFTLPETPFLVTKSAA